MTGKLRELPGTITRVQMAKCADCAFEVTGTGMAVNAGRQHAIHEGHRVRVSQSRSAIVSTLASA